MLESVLKLAVALYITYGKLQLPIGLSGSTENINIVYSTFDNLVIYGFLMAALSVLMLIIRRIYCHRRYAECELNLKKYYDHSLFRQISHFAGWSLLGTASSMIANYGQGFVMNVFFGTSVNAAQGVANQISGQLGVLSNTLIKALNPMIDKSEGAGDRTLMLKATMMGSKVSFFLIMVFYIPFLIETPFILKLWLKNIPDFSIIFSRLLLIRFIIEQLFIPLTSAISAEGNIKEYQLGSSILSFLPITISYVLFNYGYPAYALYVTFIIYSVLVSLVILYFAKKSCQLSLTVFFSNVVGRCAIAFGLVFLLSLIPYSITEVGYQRLIDVMLMSFISYLFVVFYIGFSREERVKIRQLVLFMSKRFTPKA